MMAADRPDPKLMFQFTLRRRGVSDLAVLRAMEEVPRELFVAPEFAADAYRDAALPIACGQTISQPFVVAYMCDQLELGTGHRVLEVGTGSGYHAAVMSRLCASVTTIERFRTLAEQAQRRFKKLGYANIEVIVSDGLNPSPDLGPFDRILVTAAMSEVPQPLLDALDDGGVLVGPVGNHRTVQKLVKLRRSGEGVERKNLIDVRFVPALPGVAREL